MSDAELRDEYLKFTGASVDRLQRVQYQGGPGGSTARGSSTPGKTVYNFELYNPYDTTSGIEYQECQVEGYSGSDPFTYESDAAEGVIAEPVDATYRIVVGTDAQNPILLDPDPVPYPGPADKIRVVLLPESKLFIQCLQELYGKGKKGGFDEFDVPTKAQVQGGVGLKYHDMRRVWVRRLAMSVWVDRKQVFPWRLDTLAGPDFHLLVDWSEQSFFPYYPGPSPAIDPVGASKYPTLGPQFKMVYPATAQEVEYGSGSGGSQNIWRQAGQTAWHFGYLWDPNPKVNFAAAAVAALRYMFDKEQIGPSMSWKTQRDGVAAAMYHVYSLSFRKDNNAFDSDEDVGIGLGYTAIQGPKYGAVSYAPWISGPNQNEVAGFNAVQEQRAAGAPELALYLQAVLRAMNIPSRVIVMPTLSDKPRIAFWQNLGCAEGTSEPFQLKPAEPQRSFVGVSLMNGLRRWAIICPTISLGLSNAELMYRRFGHPYVRDFTDLWTPLPALVQHWAWMKGKSLSKPFPVPDTAASSLQGSRLEQAVLGFCATGLTRYPKDIGAIIAAAKPFAHDLVNFQDALAGLFPEPVRQAFEATFRARFFSLWWARGSALPEFQLWPLTWNPGLLKPFTQRSGPKSAIWWYNRSLALGAGAMQKYLIKEEQSVWLPKLNEFLGASSAKKTLPAYGSKILVFQPGNHAASTAPLGQWLQCRPQVSQAIDQFARDVLDASD